MLLELMDLVALDSSTSTLRCPSRSTLNSSSTSSKMDHGHKLLRELRLRLTQGANVVTIRNQCPDIFEPLWDRLWYAEMGIAVSSYDVGSHSDIAPQCLGNCEQSKAKISNL